MILIMFCILPPLLKNLKKECQELYNCWNGTAVGVCIEIDYLMEETLKSLGYEDGIYILNKLYANMLNLEK